MDSLTALKVILLGLVEGLTEFLPISSTGHLIIAADWLEFPGQTGLNESTAAAFLVFIQLGAILAVVCFYWRTFWEIARDFHRPGRSRRLLLNLVIGTIPAVIIGLPTEDWIEHHLMKPIPVAAALVVGGIAILLVERFVKHAPGGDVHDITWREALAVGCFQVLAILFPGMSRSGSTILGGLSLGLARKTATEFSFFLAVPAMFGASIIKLYSAREGLSAEAVPIFSLGFAAAFLSALIVIRWLLHFVASHTFASFAWYRIVFGGVLLIVYANAASFPETGVGEPPAPAVRSESDGTERKGSAGASLERPIASFRSNRGMIALRAMNAMSYKNHLARMEYSDQDGCFVGRIAGIRDVVGFHGDSVPELRAAFEEAVDDYLETCGRLGRSPQRKEVLTELGAKDGLRSDWNGDAL